MGEQPSTSEGPITPERAQKEVEQAESVWIKNMDDWKTSVPHNGEFFIEVGKKEDSLITPTATDTRALILKESSQLTTPLRDVIPDDNVTKLDRELATIIGDNNTDLAHPAASAEPQEQHAVLTRKGVKIITLSSSDEFESLLSEADTTGGFDPVSQLIRWTKDGSASHYKDLPDNQAGDEFFDEALTKSIQISQETSESAKNQKILDAAKREQARAQRYLKTFNKLNQPPISEGPAAPPPSTPPPSPAI